MILVKKDDIKLKVFDELLIVWFKYGECFENYIKCRYFGKNVVIGVNFVLFVNID